jgi:Ca2+-binding RTX toxin-like protein
MKTSKSLASCILRFLAGTYPVSKRKGRKQCAPSSAEVQVLETRQVLSAVVGPQLLNSTTVRSGDSRNTYDGLIGNGTIQRASESKTAISSEVGADRDKNGLGIIAGKKEYVHVIYQTLDMQAAGSHVVAVSLNGKELTRRTVPHPVGHKWHEEFFTIGEVPLGYHQLTVTLDPEGAINEGADWRRGDNTATYTLKSMDPKVITVTTHGFGAPVNFLGLQLPIVDQTAWQTNAIGGFPEAVMTVPSLSSRFDNRMYVQSNQWDSSDGWVQAVSAQVLAYSGLTPPGTLGFKVLNKVSQLQMRRAGRIAALAAEQIVADLEKSEELLHPELSQNGQQIIHLIGHSRGAAVNARVATLLTQKGYQIDQYTALDGYSTDWAWPFNILADISIPDEVGAADVRRRVNYLVQDGLLEAVVIPVSEWFSMTIDKYLQLPGNGDGSYSEVTKERLRKQLPDAKAPTRPTANGWENKMIVGNGSNPRSNHMNVAELYFESGTASLPGDQRYLWDNFVGEHRNDKLKTGAPLPGQATTGTATRVPSDSSFFDGGMDSLDSMLDSLGDLKGLASGDSGLDALLAYFSRPETYLTEFWGAEGGVSVINDSSGNSWLELKQTPDGQNASIRQNVLIPDLAPTLEFDLDVKSAGVGDRMEIILQTMEGSNLKDQFIGSIDLRTPQSRKQTLRLPETTARTGEIIFRLTGSVSDPSRVLLDNLTVVSRPVTLNGSILTIEGGSGSDIAVVKVDTVNGSLLVTMNQAEYRFVKSQVSLIKFDGRGGNDVFRNRSDIRAEAKGGGGNDFLRGGRVADLLEGDADNDRLLGAGGDDVLKGGSGDDVLRGGRGVDVFDGGAGLDRYVQDPGDAMTQDAVRLQPISRNAAMEVVRVRKREGVTAVNAATSNGGRVRVEETPDEFVVYYSPAGSFIGNEAILVNSVDEDQETESQRFVTRVEPFVLQNGVLSISGGDGNDVASVAQRGEHLVVRLNGMETKLLSRNVQTIQFHGSAGNDQFTSDSSITTEAYGGDGNDVLSGGNGNDKLFGGAGDDLLTGADGDDLLEGDSGNDRLNGNRGIDRLFGGNGLDWLYGGMEGDYLDGGSGDDMMFGGEGNDLILGSSGADTIDGEAGHDDLRGGDGNDVLYGGDGLDSLSGESGDDLLYGGADADSLNGGDGRDQLFGQRGGDSLFGNDGMDWLDGGLGDDFIDGGNGDDGLFGGEGNDLLIGAAGNDALYGEQGDDTLRGVGGNDQLRGGAGKDRLSGGDGDDSLYGDEGMDTLDGDAGYDLLDGGLGDDVLDGRTDVWRSNRDKKFRGWIWQ